MESMVIRDWKFKSNLKTQCYGLIIHSSWFLNLELSYVQFTNWLHPNPCDWNKYDRKLKTAFMSRFSWYVGIIIYLKWIIDNRQHLESFLWFFEWMFLWCCFKKSIKVCCDSYFINSTWTKWWNTWKQIWFIHSYRSCARNNIFFVGSSFWFIMPKGYSRASSWKLLHSSHNIIISQWNKDTFSE